MRKYQVIENHVEIGAGRVMLNADQFKTRSHNLSAQGQDGSCEIVKPIQFKAGEVFGFDGDFGKHLSQFVTEIDAPNTFISTESATDPGKGTLRLNPAKKAVK